MLYLTRNVDSSFYYGTKAKRMAARINYRKGQTDADHVIAVTLYNRGVYPEALELLGKVLSAYQKLGDTANIACIYMDMAKVMNKDINKANVAPFLQKAIRTGAGLKRDSSMAEIYVAYCLMNTKLSADSTNYYMAKSREIASRYKNEAILIFNQIWAADTLTRKGKKQQALPLITQALADVKRTDNALQEINVYFALARYHYDDNPRKSLEYCNKAYQLAKKFGDKSLEVYLLTDILEQTTKLGTKDEIIAAHVALEKAMVAEKENTKKFIGDYVRYNAIEDDNRLLNEKNERKTGYLIVSVTSLIATVLALFKVWHNRKKLLLLNKEISNQNSNMQKTLNALEQSQAENTRMMQIVAHDLRNPIGGIYSIASLMLEDSGRTEDDRTMLELIKTSGQNSLDLVNDLLQLHTHAEELKKDEVDLDQLLHYCVDLLQSKANEKGQQIVLSSSSAIALISQEKMWRVLSNLIGNAIKFSPKKGKIEVSLGQSGSNVLISVKDRGIGIPPEIRDKVFDMFTEAKRSGTAGEQPFGLGLAISKQIVEAHGGSLWFDSIPGNGTTFFLKLPKHLPNLPV